MKCIACGHEQDSGKFCGKCGNSLLSTSVPIQESGSQQESTSVTSAQPAAAPGYEVPVNPQVHVQKVKETSKAYWNYFLGSLYNPSKALNENDKNFINAIITFAIFALITSLGINKIIGSLLGFLGEFGLGPSFIEVFFRTALVLGLIFALSIGSLFIVSKLFGPQTPIKTLITMVGGYLVPMSVIVFATFLLLLIGSLGIGSSLFFMALFFSFYVMPLFLITSLVNQKSQQIDKFYAVGTYVVLFSIGVAIFSTIYTESTIIPAVEAFFSLLNPYGRMPF